MPALNFQKQFADKVKKGEKLQTIRAIRKRPFVRGDVLYLYTGMRTKNCVKLGESYCIDIADVEIIDKENVKVDGMLLNRFMRDELASNDGFKNYYEMAEWFSKIHGLPFSGQLIKWQKVSPSFI